MVDLSSVMSSTAAVLAGASGVIHLAVVRHHLDYALMSAGFALMGGAQLLLAAGLLSRSPTRVRLAGSLLHSAIVATWLLSRTAGLVIVPGAEERVSFGLADTVANAFAVGVIASLVTLERVDRRMDHVALSARVARGITVMVSLAVLTLTVAAALASHHHAGPDHPAGGEPGHGHGDHAHDHG